MEQHDIEIEIRRNGEVKVHVKGVKGHKCMEYMEFFRQLVGEEQNRHLTHEYYEPDTPVHLDLEQHTHEHVHERED